MLNLATAIAHIRDLNSLPELGAFAPRTVDNPEYLRGQVELVMGLVGYEDDGDDLRRYIAGQLGVDVKDFA